VIQKDLLAVSKTPPAEGEKCVECHASEVAKWRESHHANANRLINPKTDLAAFRRSGVFITNRWETILQNGLGTPTVTVRKPDGTRSVFHPEAVIGVAPLVQHLLSFPGGRLQVLNLAYDPQKEEWFDMQAPDPRVPEDWSHWEKRGMNWNSQCAFCHMTNLRKGYDAESDRYRTTWDAMGIGCAQCHGPMEKHVASPKNPAFFNKLAVKQMIDNCGSCHARREELTGKFRAGEEFSDHYRLALPDLAGLYYPDGQVKDEDYEFGSLAMSRMGHKGIVCLDCHDPHSEKLRLPHENNALCLSCHTPPGQRGAVPVDVATHSHHEAGTPGDRCVDCHMPVTRYMVRDGRRDHGFTIPDPVLTKELGVPNSCNRCHDDKSADWAIDLTVKWYGNKMERRTRQRARVIARVEKSDNTVLPELLAMAKSEENAAWRSVLVSILGPWGMQAEVRSFLEKSLTDESPLVRSAAVRNLSQDPKAAALIKPLCDDPSRLVRLDAAWVLHDARDRTQSSYDELTEYLDAIGDQPAGALRKAQFALDEHRTDDALKWSGRAALWDATSGDAHQIHAMVLNMAGKQAEALEELRKACEVDPLNAQHPFMLALLCGEAGKPDEVVTQLKKAVAIEPTFGRAWYNLGLALAGQEKLAESIAALRHAEELLPGTAEVSYALATVYVRTGQIEEARSAATRAQSLGYPGAADLLKQLSR
jgi:predicted CXXCH cytochrome family protein